MITHKKCKGQGKAKGYGCDSLTDVRKRKYGLCMSCYAEWLYTSKEGKEMISKATLKAVKPRLELEKAVKTKKENDSLEYLKTNVKNICHTYIKERDKGKPCVSCGQSWNKDHQAGHWKKAELYSSLKYNEFNIHNQCKGCNLYNDGNVQKYSDRIHLRITRKQKADLEKLAENKSFHKWDRQELKEIRGYYKEKLKQLKNRI